MPVLHYNTALGSNGTGSSINPYNTFAAGAPADGDTVLIATGTVNREAFPAAWLNFNDITIAEYGTGAEPVLSAAVVHVPADFTSVGSGVWSLALGSNIGGNVLQDGVPMTFVAWNTNVSTTLGGAAVGSFSFDYNAFILYVKPTGGVMTGKEFEVSKRLNLIGSVQTKRGLTMRNLVLRQPSAHGVLLLNRTETFIDNVPVQVAGGARDTSAGVHYGNGIELANGCFVAEVRNCSADDVFDSAFTSQLYGGTPTRLSDHDWVNNRAARCGLAAMEIAIITNTARSEILNVLTDGLDAVDIGIAGTGWSGDRSGTTYSTYNFAGSLGSRIHNCRARNLWPVRAKKLWVSHQTGGVNYMSDSYGVGLTQYLSLSNNGAPGLAGQAEVWSNVTDDLGRVPEQGTYGTYVQAVNGVREIGALIL